MENSEITIFKNTIIYDENNYIFIQPLCDFFEINYKNQQRFIQNDQILKSEGIKKSHSLMFNDNYKRAALTKKGFVRWIQLLNPNIVKSELREKLIQYQCFIFDYIYGEPLIPNIKRQFEIDSRMKVLNREINNMLSEHKILDTERKQITKRNYNQLGLDFYDDQKEIELKFTIQKKLF